MSDMADFSEVDKLAADLDRSASEIEPMTETKVLSVVGRQVQTDAIADAPRDTGELASSIYLRGGQGWRIIGTDVKQGRFQELGTSRHPPQPWLYPAGDKGADDLERLLHDVADPLP